jgi:hypothetical protein
VVFSTFFDLFKSEIPADLCGDLSEKRILTRISSPLDESGTLENSNGVTTEVYVTRLERLDSNSFKNGMGQGT